MKWIPIPQPPKKDVTEVLMARFKKGGELQTITRGFYYIDPEGDGFFAPSSGTGFTHWMPYEDYWKFMRQLPKE